MILIPIYFLLYKINNYPHLWIFKTDEYLSNLIEHINGFESDYEKYYIIKRVVKKENITRMLDRKQFRRFTVEKYDKILRETIIIKMKN